jgi:hypothetical protein
MKEEGRGMANNAEALRKWNMLDKVTQNKLLENVYCKNCSITTIVDYVVTSSKPDIVLKGKCQKCKGDVARLIEWEWFN